MEAVAALSLACNIIQIIGVGNNAIEAVYQVYKYGSSIDNARLEEIASRLQSLMTHSVTTDPQLQQVAENCQMTSKQLIDELSSLKGKGKRDAIKKGFLAIRKRGELEKLKASLDDQERLLNTGILLRLKEQSDAAAVVWRSDFKDLDQTLQLFIKHLVDGNVQVQSILTAEAASTRQHVSDEHENTRAFVKDIYTRTVTEHQREKFLGSLKFSLMNARRNQITSQYPQTFEWIYESHSEWTSFPDWLKDGVDTYFVEGKAASGKSTLMKFMAGNPRTEILLRQWAPTVRIVSHYFWLAGEPLQRNLQGLFLSLVYQLLLENDDVLLEVLTSDKEEPSDWSLAELSELFHKLTISGHYCVFLDGLDEFGDNPEALTGLLETLAAQPNVKLCVSSRPDKFYLHQAQPCSVIRLQELTKADIRRYTVSRLTEAQKRGQFITIEGQEKIVGEIIIKADGVFLWVSLALDSVLRGVRSRASMAELEARIAQLPGDVVRLYENMLDRMGDDWSLIRVEAALYFRIFLSPTISGSYSMNTYRGGGAKVYQYAVILNRVNGISESDLTGTVFMDEVYRMVNRITSVCAGFLDIEQPTGNKNQEWLEVVKKDRGLQALTEDYSHKFYDIANLSIVCTHRTAYDFLTQQPKGQSLTEACDVSNYDIWRFSLEARELFMKWRGTMFTWADVINAVLELNNMEIDGMLRSSQDTFDALKYIRACFVEGLRSERQQHPREGNPFFAVREESPSSHQLNHTKMDPDFANIILPTYPYKQICAVDYMGLTLEAARMEYFHYTIEPYFQEGRHSNPLRQEYLDYLLLSISRSHWRFPIDSRQVETGSKTENVIRLLLNAGANLFTSLFRPIQGSKHHLRLDAATHLLYGYKALACGSYTAPTPNLNKLYPRGFLAFIPPNLFSTIGTRQFNLSARVYMEVNIPYRSPISMTESEVQARFVLEHHSATKDLWQLEKHIILVAPADNLKDAWRVSAQESLELLSFIDRWRSAQDDDRTYKTQFNEMIDEICVRSNHVYVEQYLRDEGYLKDSTDPAAAHGIVQPFKAGIDISTMPEW